MTKTRRTVALASVATVALLAVVGTTVVNTTNVFATGSANVYNPDMTDWWDDMIEALGDRSSTTWSEPGWGSDVWVEIEDAGESTYRISLFGIAESGGAISYTITETENGYDKYGPAMSDGSVDSRTYITSTGDDALASQPTKPSHLTLSDSRSGQGNLSDSDSHCWLADDSWFTGDVTDDWNGSKMNYRANNDAWDNCSKPLTPDDTNLTWKNGSYTDEVNNAATSGSPYFYTPSPDGSSSFKVKINWN